MRTIILLFILLILIPSASAYAELDIQNIQCLANGAYRFAVTNIGDTEVHTNRITITPNPFIVYEHPRVNTPYTTNFPIPSPGNWDTSILSPSQTTLFTSQKNVLTHPAKYHITLTYPHCYPTQCQFSKSSCILTPLPFCTTFTEVECPGVQPYGCDAVFLDILSCMNENNYLTLTYRGLEQGLYTDIDPLFGVRYVFYGTKEHFEQEWPPNMTVEETERDTYIVRFPLTQGNIIERASVEEPLVCGHQAFTNCDTPYTLTNGTAPPPAPPLEPNQTPLFPQDLFGQPPQQTSPEEPGQTVEETIEETLEKDEKFTKKKVFTFYITGVIVIVLLFIFFRVRAKWKKE